MDLGLAGKWALVCAQALVAEGVNVVITARGNDALQATAAELRAINPAVQVLAVAGDITTAEGRAAALAACPQVDILVNNAGGPLPGDFRNWDRSHWLSALDANMLTPIELIKAVVDGMAERGFGRIVNITSAAVKAPIDILGLSNGARSGLTGFVAGVARQPRLASRNVTINALRPFRHRPPARHHGRCRCQGRQAAGRGDGRTAQAQPHRPVWACAGIWCGLRLSVQSACQLHHWAEPADGRRCFPRHVLRRRSCCKGLFNRRPERSGPPTACAVRLPVRQ